MIVYDFLEDMRMIIIDVRATLSWPNFNFGQLSYIKCNGQIWHPRGQTSGLEQCLNLFQLYLITLFIQIGEYNDYIWLLRMWTSDFELCSDQLRLYLISRAPKGLLEWPSVCVCVLLCVCVCPRSYHPFILDGFLWNCARRFQYIMHSACDKKYNIGQRSRSPKTWKPLWAITFEPEVVIRYYVKCQLSFLLL